MGGGAHADDGMSAHVVAGVCMHTCVCVRARVRLARCFEGALDTIPVCFFLVRCSMLPFANGQRFRLFFCGSSGNVLRTDKVGSRRAFLPWGVDGMLQLAKDLLSPSEASERRKHKLKRLVQSPNSFFMDVKCPGCFQITTVFSHAQTVVLCAGCATVLSQPTGGRARLSEGCSFRKKTN